MALSDYERRVLDEIEAELNLRPARRRRLGRSAALAAGVLAALALIVLAAVMLAPGPAVIVAGTVGAVVGYLAAISWRGSRGG